LACRGTVDRVPNRIGFLEGVRSPFSMAVEENDLFVVDENHVVRVYSIEPFAPRFTLGGKGNGPRELQYLPSPWVASEPIVVPDFMKSLRFTRGGQFREAVTYSDFPDFDPG